MKLTIRGKHYHLTTYELTLRVLSVLVVVLACLLVVIPGTLRLMHRAEANAAIGNAKVVRTALRATALEGYGLDTDFTDTTAIGGVNSKEYTKIIEMSEVPGSFQVLQISEDRTDVLRFYYIEGPYIVFFDANPSTYKVYRTDFFGEHLAPNE